MYLEPELQYTEEGVTFELSLRRSSVGRIGILGRLGVHWVWHQLFGRGDTHVRLRHNRGPTIYIHSSTTIRNKLFPAQLWDKAKVERKWVQLLL